MAALQKHENTKQTYIELYNRNDTEFKKWLFAVLFPGDYIGFKPAKGYFNNEKIYCFRTMGRRYLKNV